MWVDDVYFLEINGPYLLVFQELNKMSKACACNVLGCRPQCIATYHFFPRNTRRIPTNTRHYIHNEQITFHASLCKFHSLYPGTHSATRSCRKSLKAISASQFFAASLCKPIFQYHSPVALFVSRHTQCYSCKKSRLEQHSLCLGTQSATRVSNFMTTYVGWLARGSF